MSEPKFKPDDRVIDVGNGKAGVVKAISPVDGAILVRFSADFCWWYDSNHLDRLQPVADPPRPRFQPGQRVRINGMANPKWNGREGVIVGPETDVDPGWKDGGWRVEYDAGGTPEVNSFHHSKLEPITERLHDGQANTSGIDLGPIGRKPGPSDILDWYKGTATPKNTEPASIPIPQPNLLTVLVGVHRWQQADPAHRRAHVSLSGHTATVHITTLPDLGARRVTFCSAYSAREVVDALDGLAPLHPDAEVKMARNDVRFAEDTGETD